MSRPVSILDFADHSAADTIATARLAEGLGYARYWLAEHYESPVHSDALLLAAAVAGATGRIRVGPAGVLTRFHPPLHIANRAALLESLYPGRIDLGLSAGTTGRRDVLASLPQHDVDATLREVSAQLNDQGQAKVLPALERPPQIWILGSGSVKKAQLAAEVGACFALSYLHQPTPPPVDLLGVYRDAFASRKGSTPRTAILVAVACAKTDKEAKETAALYDNPTAQRRVVGTPPHCREQLEQIAERYGADEIIVLDVCGALEDRDDSLKLLAREFALSSAPR